MHVWLRLKARCKFVLTTVQLLPAISWSLSLAQKLPFYIYSNRRPLSLTEASSSVVRIMLPFHLAATESIKRCHFFENTFFSIWSRIKRKIKNISRSYYHSHIPKPTHNLHIQPQKQKKERRRAWWYRTRALRLGSEDSTTRPIGRKVSNPGISSRQLDRWKFWLIKS